MTIISEHHTWAEVSEITKQYLSDELRHALQEFGQQEIVQIKVPYGEKIIRNGVFRWDLLGEMAKWESDYHAPIPVALVASKTVELYDITDHYSNKLHEKVKRSRPMAMMRAGQFFGLFENFADYSGNNALRATAGGTTLIALLALGTKRNLKQYLEGLGICYDSDTLECIANNLKTELSSKMTFGPFFREVLRHHNCKWHCEIAVLSPAFVNEIKNSDIANLAMHKMTLAQLALSHRRADQTLKIIIENERSNNNAKICEIQTMHLIADGIRPGFFPVINSDVDEEVLPAEMLHKLIYQPELLSSSAEAKPLDSEHHFPIVFRPSLPGEPSFYFLGRPYLKGEGRGANAKDRALALLKALEGKSEKGKFWNAEPTLLKPWLINLAKSDGTKIKLPKAGSYFLKSGIIGFIPTNEGDR